MADASNRLKKLARLKQMKSDLNKDQVEDDDDVLSLDDVLPDAPAPEPEPAPAPVAEPAAPEPTATAPAPPEPAPAPKPTAKAAAKPGKDTESLSAYFEALGLAPSPEAAEPAAEAEPDEPPAPATDAILLSAHPQPRQDAIPLAAPEPAAEARPQDRLRKLKKTQLRDIESEDLWKDPVRDGNDALLGALVDSVNPLEEAPSIESILGGDSQPAPEPDTETAEAVDEAPRPSKPDPISVDGPLTIAFDEHRANLLEHVARQMNCTVDDVVVTAVDWYLDALFGDDHTMEPPGDLSA